MWAAPNVTVSVVGLMVTAVMTVGSACTADGERSPDPVRPPRIDVRLLVPTAPLTTTARLSSLDTIHRTGNGLTLLVYSLRSNIRSAFRIYDQDWRPLTPLLRIDASLIVERTTRSTFVGLLSGAIRSNGRALGPVVVITRDGTVRAAAHQWHRGDRSRGVRIGDVPLVTGIFPPTEVYRPSQDRVFQRTMPAWYRTFHQTWSTDADRGVCTSTSRAPIGADVHSSTSSGVRWSTTSTRALPPATGPWLGRCAVSPGRVFVTTGHEQPQWGHVLTRGSGRLLSSHRLGVHRYDRYVGMLLTDGILVAPADRRGLRFGTDSTNRTMVYRPGPIGRRSLPRVLGRDVIITDTGLGRLHVSHDAGRTWQRVDLDLPPAA